MRKHPVILKSTQNYLLGKIFNKGQFAGNFMRQNDSDLYVFKNKGSSETAREINNNYTDYLKDNFKFLFIVFAKKYDNFSVYKKNIYNL